MAVGNYREFKRDIEPVEAKEKGTGTTAGAGPGTTAGAGTTNNKSTVTTGATTGAGTTAGTANNTGAGTGTKGAGKEKKEPIEVAVLVPEPKKQRKPRAKKKEEPASALGASEISDLIVNFSNIIGSREGLEIWKISKKEADTIATPLYNLCEKSEIFKKVSEHSDGIALATACITVFTPRTIYTLNKMKGKKKHVRKLETPVPRKQGGEVKRDSGNDSGQNGGRSADVVTGDYDIPPAINQIM